MDVFRRAYVYVNDLFAGILEETDDGYLFTYESLYLKTPGACAVSVTMPLQEDSYASKILFPFFDGLIPEGWMLSVVSRNWKLDMNDRFGILLVACKDCIGNVSIRDARK